MKPKLETAKQQAKEDKQIVKLRNGIFEVKRELKKHEAEPMGVAHKRKK